jgi:Fur family ferric uptake transcriptional regulator
MNTKELMTEHNLKVTAPRASLLEVFMKSDKPLCYEEVKTHLKMDKTTFYRNMTTFEEAGIINGFESDDKKRYFELSQTKHAHFICKKCHSVECLNQVGTLNLIGYEVDNFILHGTCKKCNN